jgi:hypothetical protein
MNRLTAERAPSIGLLASFGEEESAKKIGNRVEVHNCVDVRIPVLARVHDEHSRTYSSLGFEVAKSR